MAYYEKRGKSYRIISSCGYNIYGKQIEMKMTWKPNPSMTPNQIEKELKRQLVLFEEKCKSGVTVNGATKFIDFADRWLEEYNQNNLKKTTINGYKVLLKRINPAIGHLKLEKIQPTHLMKLYSNLAKPGIRDDIKYSCNINMENFLKRENITRKQLSDASSVSETTIRSLCNGGNVTLRTANNIAYSLHLSLRELFTPVDKDNKLSDKFILEHHRLISAILNAAVKCNAILINPCTRLNPPRVKHKESRYLDDEDAIKVFECLEKENIKYRALVTLITYTGMRRGEACGLLWSDIDFEHSVINICRQILYLSSIGIYEDTPKTLGSVRTLKVPELVIDVLKVLRVEQEKLKLQMGDQWIDTGRVFTQWNGETVNPTSITAWFHKFIIKNNLPDISIHSLRHTNATLLIANGVNITTVSKRLGHSNTGTTTKIYAHAIATADAIASETLQDIFHPKKTT